MREFEDLPEYETLADMISSQLKKEGVEHAFANEGGKRFLVFKAKETPSVARAFRRIEESIPEACERAKGVLAKGEPLKERAARARAAAEQIAHEHVQQAGRGHERDILKHTGGTALDQIHGALPGEGVFLLQTRYHCTQASFSIFHCTEVW